MLSVCMLFLFGAKFCPKITWLIFFTQTLYLARTDEQLYKNQCAFWPKVHIFPQVFTFHNQGGELLLGNIFTWEQWKLVQRLRLCSNWKKGDVSNTIYFEHFPASTTWPISTNFALVSSYAPLSLNLSVYPVKASP